MNLANLKTATLKTATLKTVMLNPVLQKDWHTLNFYHACVELFQPCLPLLTDLCHISVAQARHAMPVLVKAVIYQSLNILQTQGQGAFISEVLHADLLTSFQNGITFKQLDQLEKLQPVLLAFRHTLFKQNLEGKNDHFVTPYVMLIGLLAQRTGLAIAPLIALFDKVALLTLKLLADIHTLATTAASQALINPPLTDNAFFDWLALQPMRMASLDDNALITVLGYQPARPWGQYLAPQSLLPHNTAIKAELTTLAPLAKVIAEYKLTQPLSIVPREFLAKPHRLTASPPDLLDTANPSIFTAENPQKNKATPPWQQTLQRHWMLSAGVLTGIVFGGIALLSPIKEKPPSAVTANQLDSMPHDVAIVRVKSTPKEVAHVDASTTPVTAFATSTTAVAKLATKTAPPKESPADRNKKADTAPKTKPSTAQTSPTKSPTNANTKTPSKTATKATPSHKTAKSAPSNPSTKTLKSEKTATANPSDKNKTAKDGTKHSDNAKK